MRRGLVALAALAGIGVAPFAACSDAPAPAGAVASEMDASDGARNTPDGSSTPDGAPEYNVDGWTKIDFDPDYDCGIYAAPSPDKMPPPIVWEPCEAIVNSTGYACRQIRFDWSKPTGDFANLPMMGPGTGWTAPDGKPWLAFKRFTGPAGFEVVAEADGRVHMALSYSGRKCVLASDVSLNGTVIFETSRTESGSDKILRSGAIGGGIDELPRVVESSGDGKARSYVAGPNAYFAFADSSVQPWSPGGQKVSLSVTDPGAINYPRFQSEALFFTVSNSAYGRIKVYTPLAGHRDLVSFGDDVSHSAVDFGTDGTDMVWIEGEGRSSSAEPFQTVDIVTAKYTTEPSALQKRRLRSGLGSVGAAPFTVGCGFAARQFAIESGVGVQLVRLSDGRSWPIMEIPGKPYWTWLKALALTCDEIFLNVSTGGTFRISRVRLDSLGSGEAAD